MFKSSSKTLEKEVSYIYSSSIMQLIRYALTFILKKRRKDYLYWCMQCYIIMIAIQGIGLMAAFLALIVCELILINHPHYHWFSLPIHSTCRVCSKTIILTATFLLGVYRKIYDQHHYHTCTVMRAYFNLCTHAIIFQKVPMVMMSMSDALHFSDNYYKRICSRNSKY